MKDVEHPSTLKLRELSDRLRKKVAQLEQAVESFAAIHPEARPFFSVFVNSRDEYIGITCNTCDGLHARPVEDGVVILEESKPRRHEFGCLIAELEKALEPGPADSATIREVFASNERYFARFDRDTCISDYDSSDTCPLHGKKQRE